MYTFTFVPTATPNQLFLYRKYVLSPSAKKASFSLFYLLNVNSFSVLSQLLLIVFHPQYRSASALSPRRLQVATFIHIETSFFRTVHRAYFNLFSIYRYFVAMHYFLFHR